MDVVVRQALSQSAILNVTEHNGILAMTCGGETGTALFYAERTNGTWKKHSLRVTPDRTFSKQGFGAYVKFGQRNRFIYVTSKDEDAILILSGSELSDSYQPQKTVKDVFDSPILGLWLLKDNAKQIHPKCFLIAISQTGEILLIDDNSDELPIRMERTLTSSLDCVLKVSQISDDSLALIAEKDGNHQLHIVRFGSLEAFESIEICQASPLLLFEGSKVPTDSSSARKKGIVDFALKRDCLCVLYQGGHVCFFKSREADFHAPAMASLDFQSFPDQHDQKVAPLSAFLANAVTLYSSLDDVQMSDKGFENSGFVDNVEGDFFIVGYGKYISVWDRQYLVGHDYVQVERGVRTRSSGISTTEHFFVSDDGLEEVLVPLEAGSRRVSLGMAMRRKEACSALFLDVHQTMEKAPLRSQPLPIAPIKAAADASSNSTKMFKDHISNEDEREDSLIRDLLTKSATPSAESVMALVREETRTVPSHARRVRNRDHKTMGLSKLPSERLAAVTVARCLYDLQSGDAKFLVPLIDMIGTGVVSNEAVLAVADISDSWGMGNDRVPFQLQSIVDPLLASVDYSHALEGVISTVGDLPQQDFVRVLRHVVRLLEETNEKKENGVMRANGLAQAHDSHSSETRKRVRCQRLLERCFECSMDKDQCIQSVRRLPFSDILMILRRFKIVLGDVSPSTDREDLQVLGKPLKGLQSGTKDVTFDKDAAKCYRGVSNWTDNDRITKRKRRTVWIRGCIAWTCHMIDAHLSTLILDESGRELAEQLLQAVKVRRKGLEELKSLEGLADHLAHRKGVPSGTDALYNKRMLLVPHDVGLL